MHIWERCADYLKKISTVILAASVIIWALTYFPRPAVAGDAVAGTETSARDYEHCYLAGIGRAMDPVMAPLGFDWRMNVCILTGLPAKEAIVSTMAILYHEDTEISGNPEDTDSSDLAATLRAHRVFTPVTAFGFMMFVLLYFPCVATIATLRREIGWRWALFSVFNSIFLAWLVAFLVNRLALML